MTYGNWRRLAGNTAGTHLEMVTLLSTGLREMSLAGGEHAATGERTPYGRVRQALTYAMGQLVSTREGIELMHRVWTGDLIPDTEGVRHLHVGVDRWNELDSDHEALCVQVADLLAGLLYEMNLAGGDHGPHIYGVDDPELPYGHVKGALCITLVGLTGNKHDADRIYELHLDNGEDIAHNLGVLREEIEAARTVTVEVSPDGTAVIHGPGDPYFVGRVGRVAGSGLLWVTDDDVPDRIAGHVSSHAEAGELMARRHGVAHRTTVKVIERPI